ncbi:MAG: sulfatase-like hydrolase/transferase, partial [Bacteriovoracaceae bacterium]|nr:sulfatase-like hydrolase/transferase [Bacteriovoracaceae bacterium]
QLGSHGPAYHLRHPPEFANFVPECKSSNFSECTQQEIINSYDNTILYTDHVLKNTIDYLKTKPDFNTAFMYVSDHGESLGENNLYLHGLPYWFAPNEQKQIPLFFWANQKFKQTFALDSQCLQQKSNLALSHDNIFHSLLGLTKVESSYYKESDDIFYCYSRKLSTK